jgi:hypothetical protein
MEVVAGQRRLAAARLAKLDTVPCIVRELSDAEARELSIVENLLHEHLNYLDEAKGFEQLLGSGLNPLQVADKVGKSEAFIVARVALTKLIHKLQPLAYDGRMTVGNAIRLARLTPDTQNRFLQDIKPRIQYGVNSDELKRFMERQVFVELKRAPFDTADPNLVPAAGACHNCPKRSGSAPLLFPDVKEKDTCTDPGCFKAKCNALLAIRQKEFPKAAKIYVGHLWGEEKQLAEKQHAIPECQYDGDGGWKPSHAGACESTQDGIVVGGDLAQIGNHRLVCAEPKCPVHAHARARDDRPPKQLGVLNEEAAKQTEELWQRRTRRAVCLALHAAVRKAASSFRSVPMEVFRFLVRQAANAIKPNQDGTIHLLSIWKPKEQGTADTSWFNHPLDAVIARAKDHTTLLQLLIDVTVADDVANKFGGGDQIRKVAKDFGLNLEAISAPVKAEWDKKKKESYNRRTARLAKEREKLARLKAAESKDAKTHREKTTDATRKVHAPGDRRKAPSKGAVQRKQGSNTGRATREVSPSAS